ncbi:N-glycosidase [Psilocybe cubensis]|uniref:N-glycosidase n=2 Tax=Psilocybe cubensis TaxID=181762 RepID=A0ACB8GQ59_PSICU|nr:N-glycosidase [Psilocybe cubensis]KAH9477865.1 N-glycosidase [Psilocybe cubensis]
MRYVKGLGRKVQGFDEETWVAAREKIVLEGNLLKFQQNPEIKEKLMATGSKHIVEASPRDRIWGIGFGEKNAMGQKERWGLNLLGKALEKTRKRAQLAVKALNIVAANKPTTDVWANRIENIADSGSTNTHLSPELWPEIGQQPKVTVGTVAGSSRRTVTTTGSTEGGGRSMSSTARVQSGIAQSRNNINVSESQKVKGQQQQPSLITETITTTTRSTSPSTSSSSQAPKSAWNVPLVPTVTKPQHEQPIPRIVLASADEQESQTSMGPSTSSGGGKIIFGTIRPLSPPPPTIPASVSSPSPSTSASLGTPTFVSSTSIPFIIGAASSTVKLKSRTSSGSLNTKTRARLSSITSIGDSTNTSNVGSSSEFGYTKKWKFGTTSRGGTPPPVLLSVSSSATSSEDASASALSSATATTTPSVSVSVSVGTSAPSSPLPPPLPLELDDDMRVRDFGYGFGQTPQGERVQGDKENENKAREEGQEPNRNEDQSLNQQPYPHPYWAPNPNAYHLPYPQQYPFLPLPPQHYQGATATSPPPPPPLPLPLQRASVEEASSPRQVPVPIPLPNNYYVPPEQMGAYPHLYSPPGPPYPYSNQLNPPPGMGGGRGRRGYGGRGGRGGARGDGFYGHAYADRERGGYEREREKEFVRGGGDRERGFGGNRDREFGRDRETGRDFGRGSGPRRGRGRGYAGGGGERERNRAEHYFTADRRAYSSNSNGSSVSEARAPPFVVTPPPRFVPLPLPLPHQPLAMRYPPPPLPPPPGFAPPPRPILQSGFVPQQQQLEGPPSNGYNVPLLHPHPQYSSSPSPPSLPNPSSVAHPQGPRQLSPLSQTVSVGDASSSRSPVDEKSTGQHTSVTPSSPLPKTMSPQPLQPPKTQPHHHPAPPPVPAPLTPIPFPLDPTRYWLLGQLEYYLSPQNMAHDIFLRRNMDSKGWIPIELIASFNRVKTLTMDVALVRDVLALSSIAQVRRGGAAALSGDDVVESKGKEEQGADNEDKSAKEGLGGRVDANVTPNVAVGWVRMQGWERYVLPDARPSTVPEQEEENGVGGYGYTQTLGYGAPYGNALYGLSPPPPPLPLHPEYSLGPSVAYGYGQPPFPPRMIDRHAGHAVGWEENPAGRHHGLDGGFWRPPPVGGFIPGTVNGHGYGYEQNMGQVRMEALQVEGPGAKPVNGHSQDTPMEKVSVGADELAVGVEGLRLGDDGSQVSPGHVNVKDKETPSTKKGHREEGDEPEDEDEEEDEEDIIFVMGTQSNVSWVS